MPEENKEVTEESKSEEENKETEESTEEEGSHSLDDLSEEDESESEEDSEDSEDEDSEESTLSEDDLETAKTLLKTLRDPKQSKAAVLALAKNLGVELEDAKGKVSKTPEKATDAETGKRKKIADIVSSKLPENWAPLAPVLTAILEELNQNYIEGQFKVSNEQKHAERSDNAWNQLTEKHADATALQDKMSEIATKIAPTKLDTQADYNRYAEMIYKLAKQDDGASGDLGDQISKILNKTKKNAKRAKPGPSDASRTKRTVKFKDSNEAVDAAFRELKIKS